MPKPILPPAQRFAAEDRDLERRVRILEARVAAATGGGGGGGGSSWTFPLSTPVTFTVNGQTATWGAFFADPLRYRKLDNGLVVFAGAAAYALSPYPGGTPSSTNINTYGDGSNNWAYQVFDLFQIPTGYRPALQDAGGTMPWPRWHSASGNATMNFGSTITPTEIALKNAVYDWWLQVRATNLNEGYPLWFYAVSWFAEI